MMSRIIPITSLFLLVLITSLSTVVTGEQRKILYVDSYHESYAWSAGITLGIKSVFTNRDDVELKIIRMDTKRNPSEEFKKSAALKVKNVIEVWNPDLVIASDDNASKYLIVPYYKGGMLPFVFCGINWDASIYGFPSQNVTGMVEVQLIDQILDTLHMYTTGKRLAFIKGDDSSARIEAKFFEKHFNVEIDKRFVRDFASWKQQYIALQEEADMILIGNYASVKGWDNREALQFILETTRVPTGNWDSWMAPFSLVTFANKAEEQGEWAAETALKILTGISPSEILITTNKKGKIYLNMKLAKILGIKFPIDLIERATFVSELGE